MNLYKAKTLWILAALFSVVWVLFLPAASVAGQEEILEKKAVQEGDSREEYELETMTVTVQKQEEDVQKVPGNVTAFDGFVMEDLGVDNIDELTELTPNINIDKIDSHMTQMVFRGIGGIANMNKVWNTNVDGVAAPYVGVDTFLDVERVELIRGGQGLFYGRNTLAGVVNVITRKPTPEFSLDAYAEAESYNTQKATAAIGGPVAINQGYRLAFGYSRGDGYMKNAFLNTDDGSRHEQFSGRGIYDFLFSKDNLVRFTMTADSYNGGFDDYAPVSLGPTTTTTNNEEGENKGHLLSPTLTWERKFSEFTLTSITNYSNSDYEILWDQDFTQYDLMVFDYDEDFNTLTQELRVTGNCSRNFEWLAGIFLMLEDIDMSSDFAFGKESAYSGLHMLSDSSIDSQEAALFGQGILRLLEDLEFRAGLRLDYEKRKLTWEGWSEMGSSALGPSQDFSREDGWFGVMPSASLAYVLSDRERIYAAVDRGYKVGDYAANQVDMDAVRDPVDPEYTMTYELGYKGLLADKRLGLNAAAFYVDVTDMQVSVVKDNVALMQNAAEAHSYGAELEARWRAAKGLDLLAGLGWLKAEFDRYDNHPDGLDLSGNQLPNANEYSLSVGATYRHDSGFFGALSAASMGPKYMDEENLIKQERYTLVNAKIGYERANWAAYIYGRNLLNESYLVHTTAGAGRAGEPLIIGVKFSCLF